ncbi:aminotransferase class III-fold pyridoxal phosphate-dependent enzyme [Amycolatopsis thermoflava]|uniref:aminotransferase class III-fold pyridoxal phosphate-dependent enzyme n=1 Tax=Amycolatopsis thermoflava TaxID=84480 RepID=UPI003D7436C9
MAAGWSAQAALTPMVVTRAEGSYVWDGHGSRLLDFSSQLVNTNLGHQHPRVVEAIVEQTRRLATVAPQHANDQRGEAARLIAERTPGRGWCQGQQAEHRALARSAGSPGSSTPAPLSMPPTPDAPGPDAPGPDAPGPDAQSRCSSPDPSAARPPSWQ